MSELRERVNLVILRHEGEVLFAYDDKTGQTINPGDMVTGHVTIGRGRNLVGKGITQAESVYLFDNDCEETEVSLDRLFPWWRQMTLARQVALMDFAFNQGASMLPRKWPNTMRYLQAGNYVRVAAILRNAPWYVQVGRVRGEAIARGFEDDILP